MYGTLEDNLRILRSEYTAAEALDYAAGMAATHNDAARHHQRLAEKWRAAIRELRVGVAATNCSIITAHTSGTTYTCTVFTHR